MPRARAECREVEHARLLLSRAISRSPCSTCTVTSVCPSAGGRECLGLAVGIVYSLVSASCKRPPESQCQETAESRPEARRPFTSPASTRLDRSSYAPLRPGSRPGEAPCRRASLLDPDLRHLVDPPTRKTSSMSDSFRPASEMADLYGPTQRSRRSAVSSSNLARVS